MRFLIHSNAPSAATGYGVQCAQLVDRLVADGHQVAVSATWGQQTGVGSYTTPSGAKVPVYWSGYTQSSDDIIAAHAKHFFGDVTTGWVIPLLDIWSVNPRGVDGLNVAAWAPVDHDPVPPMVTNWFRTTKATAIAMSLHGLEQFRLDGIDALYAPLAVDTTKIKPTYEVTIGGEQVSGRQMLGVHDRAFVVGMVAMNKDPNDRKGFSEAFQAFARFYARHPNAILYLHTDVTGLAGGVQIPAMLAELGIPAEAVATTAPYAYRAGFSAEMMAAMYTSFDVLLAPSAGEGFCVPLIEAQACGTAVIASDFTAQTELVGAGWLVDGQRWWDPASRAWYLRASVPQIVDKLEAAYAADLDAMSAKAIVFAQGYDADAVYANHWRPLLATLTTDEPAADKPLMSDVAVVIPAMKRPQNVAALVESFSATNDGTASLYYVCDPDDIDQIEAVKLNGLVPLISDRGTSFASKVNDAYGKTTESFLFLCGDDVEFTPGWLEAARKLSDRYDVIGTNDSEAGRIRNPRVAAGVHADHFFVRRAYVDGVGASLEGPGIVLFEGYYHFYTDMELIQLARARGVFSPCLDSVVIHHHPGYDGREDLRAADSVYMHAVEFSEMDAIAFKRRAGLIDQHKVVRRDIWAAA